MPAWIVSILNILGLVVSDAPIIEQLLSGIGTYVANAFSSLFGGSAGTEVADILTEAENILSVVSTDVQAAVDFVNNEWPSLEALLADEPWLAQLLFGTAQIQAVAVAGVAAKRGLVAGKNSPGLSRGVLNKINEAAHANIKFKQAAAKATKKP